jgi:hypothetical protein
VITPAAGKYAEKTKHIMIDLPFTDRLINKTLGTGKPICLVAKTGPKLRLRAKLAPQKFRE